MRTDSTDTLARHDLVWHGAGFYGLQCDGSPQGPAEFFKYASITKAWAFRQDLLSRNPHMVLIMEIRYRDAGDGFLPANSIWWMRDEDGNRVPGWEEGGNYMLNYPDPGFQAHVAARCKAAVGSGVVDGVLLDWWNDDAEGPSLVRAIRQDHRALTLDPGQLQSSPCAQHRPVRQWTTHGGLRHVQAQ